MPIQISWQQPGRLIHQRFYGTITLTELRNAQQEFFHYLDNGSAPIHAIIDLADARDYPKSVGKIREALVPDETGKTGLVVIVTGSNPIIKFITSAVSQIAFKNKAFTFCSTLEEAVHYLRSRDRTITVEYIVADQ